MNKERFNWLVRRIKYNQKASEELYRYYYPSIVKHINRCFYGKLDGRDVAQQFFIKLFNMQIKETIRYPTSWVYKICDYTAIEFLRKNSKRKTGGVALRIIMQHSHIFYLKRYS